jgi:hypothetical protein
LRRRGIGAALSRVRLAAAVGGMLALADLDGEPPDRAGRLVSAA